MSAFDWMRAGAATRGTSPRRKMSRKGLIAIGLLAVLGLSQTGCKSGGCGSCGILRRTTSRMFSRTAKVAGGGCCGDATPAYTSDVPMGYSTPGEVVMPGSPGSIPSTITPGASIDSPTSLDPITNERPPKAGPDRSSGSTTPKLNYNYSNPSYRMGRPRTSNNLAQTAATSPVPASRPAREAAIESLPDDDNPLDRLPPLDLPTEVTERSQTTPPVPPAAERSLADKGKKPEAASGVKGAENPKKVPEKAASADVSAPSERSNAVGEVPGIRRLVALDLKLAGGSLPTADGLNWLAEKGYKTILDLREPSDVLPSFIAEVDRRGMRYVALPLSAGTVDADHVARFNSELSSTDARPLYFFDTDGTRPGALWYVRLITKDGFNPETARRLAEDLGLKDEAFWVAAKSFVERAAAAKIGQLPAEPDTDRATTPASTTGTPNAKPAEIKPAPMARTSPTPQEVAVAVSTLSIRVDPSNAIPRQISPAELENPVGPDEPLQNRAAWHPFAAVMMTGLTVPIAYWTRSAFPPVFTKPTASLSAGAQRPKSLPASSGD